MGIFNRRADIDRLTKELSEVKGLLSKSVSMNNPVLADIFNWGDINADAKAERLKSAYTQLPAVHACIKWKARNFAQVPFRLYKNEKEVESGNVWDLFQNFNPTIDSFQFWEGIQTCLDISGNAFIVLDEEMRYGLPAHLWLFNPDWITPAYDRSGIWVGWWLQRKTDRDQKPVKDFLPFERVIQLKYYNPNSEILGLNPLDVLKVTAGTLWSAMKYNENFFINDATPNLAYVNDGQVNARQMDEIQKKLVDDRKGVKNAHGTMLLTGGWKPQSLGLAQKDVQFLEQMKFSREDISMIYGVPKKILGLYEDINMATAQSAEIQFWEDTITPTARMVQGAINKRLLRPLGYEGRFDFSVIDVLNVRILEKVSAVTTLLQSGQFTRNELNRRFDLGFEYVPWGDEPVMPGLTLESIPWEESAAPQTTKALQGETEPERINLDKALMAQKWAKDMTPLIGIMGRAAKSIKDYFHRVERRIISSLTKRQAGQYTMKMPLDAVPVEELEKAFSDEELYTAMKPFLEDAMRRGIEAIIRTSFTMDNSEAMRILGEKRIKVLEINDTAKKQVIENLRKVLSDSLAEGQGADVTARRIIDTIGEQMENIKRRARTIARTEVNNSFSESRWAAVKEDPPKYVRWISSRDSKVRDTHAHLDGQVVKYGEKFDNGIQFPHAPDGKPEEVINCRCTWEPLYIDKNE